MKEYYGREAQIHSGQQALVDVVEKLRGINRGICYLDPKKRRGPYTVWETLPGLALETREQWGQCDPCGSESDGYPGDLKPGANEYMSYRYINFCAFYAHLLQADVFNAIPYVCLEVQGLLEHEYAAFTKPLARSTKLKVVNNFILIPGEAIWYCACFEVRRANRLRLNEESRKAGKEPEYEELVPDRMFPQHGPLWSGPPIELGLDRWNFWLKRYREILPLIQQDQALNDELKSECQIVSELMQELTEAGSACPV
ncbi:hypothetical protein OQA88_7030 [Cercophora sp. LCS_1]